MSIRADRQLLGQALANLIENSLKYAARDEDTATQNLAGEIKVWVSRVGDTAVISLADNGPGIPEEDRERALRRFVRLEASRSKPGSGLGLSLVAAVARLHGGLVKLADAKPGLLVEMTLPLHVAAEGDTLAKIS